MNTVKWIGIVLVAAGVLVAPFLYWIHGNAVLIALVVSVVGFVLVFVSRDRRAGAAALGSTGPDSSAGDGADV